MMGELPVIINSGRHSSMLEVHGETSARLPKGDMAISLFERGSFLLNGRNLLMRQMDEVIDAHDGWPME